MRAIRFSYLVLFTFLAASCSAEPGAAQQSDNGALSAEDEAAIFSAAGFARVGDQWQACEFTESPSYSPGAIEWARDLNGDGLPEALVVEGSAACFGMTGQSYALVSEQGEGGWALVTGGIGMVNVLDTTGADGWPDLEIGGPGFCFPVHRWNGSEYGFHRAQYEGEPCDPPF